MIVDAGGTNRIELSFMVGDTGQTVEVQANPVNVATETSELSQNFTHQELDTLPNLDRNALYQMNLIPGANNDVGSGNYRNQRRRERLRGWPDPAAACFHWRCRCQCQLHLYRWRSEPRAAKRVHQSHPGDRRRAGSAGVYRKIQRRIWFLRQRGREYHHQVRQQRIPRRCI